LSDSKAKAFIKALSEGRLVDEAAREAGLQYADAQKIFIDLYKKLYPDTVAVTINVDGASKGNPGKAGAGAIIKDRDGNVIKKLRKALGIATNNVAEYEALILGLEEARAMDATDVIVHADSELMVKQINGEYRVKSEGLIPLYSKAVTLKDTFRKFKISHVDREKNSEADRLANEAIDAV